MGIGDEGPNRRECGRTWHDRETGAHRCTLLAGHAGRHVDQCDPGEWSEAPLDRERFEVVGVQVDNSHGGGLVTVTLRATRAVPGGGPYVVETNEIEFLARKRDAPAIGHVFLVTVEPLRAGGT